MNNEDNRCVNVPSWSLPIALINDVSVSADVLAVSQSSIVRVALEEWFKRNPMKDGNDLIQCEKDL